MTPTKTTQSLYITKSNNSAINDNEKPLLEVMEQWFDSLPLATLLELRAKLTGGAA